MSRHPDQKLKLLYLQQILLTETDEDHPLTIREMIEKLEKLGIHAERKSLYDDIAELTSFGLDIEKVKSKATGYYVSSRDFQLPELKFLVDSVQCAKFITVKKTNELIKKLETLTSVHEAKSLQRQVYVANRVKTPNEQIYINTDTIHDAISKNRQIRFKYYEWVIDFSGTEKIRRELKHNGGYYQVSPWALTWDDENYYLVAYTDDQIKHFRVDKMVSIDVLDEARTGQEKFSNFDTARYCKKSFGMFSGSEQDVKVVFSNKFIGIVIDRFGSDVFITKYDEDHFCAVLTVVVSPVFLSWIMGFGTDAKIIYPPNVVDEINSRIDDLKKLYG